MQLLKQSQLRIMCKYCRVYFCQYFCAFCSVIIHFLLPPHQYGPFHIPEDAPVGTTVTALLARDADVRGGDSWQVDYRLESGNEEDVFTLVTDKQTNEVSLILSKVSSTHHLEASLCRCLTTLMIFCNTHQYHSITSFLSGP